MNFSTAMKITISFLSTATLLGFASLMSNFPIDAADALAIAFAAGLVAWTVSEYSRELPPLKRRAKTVKFVLPHPVSAGSRLAA
jgi:hypothetical protein